MSNKESLTSEEIEENKKKSDQELIEGGAKEVISKKPVNWMDPDQPLRLEVTKSQLENIRNEMNQDLKIKEGQKRKLLQEQEDKRIQEEQKITEQKAGETLKKIASFFDNPRQALQMLKDHYHTGQAITLDDGQMIPLDWFFKWHLEAHKKRAAQNLAGLVRLLKIELKGHLRIPRNSSASLPRTAEKPNLDRYDKRIDIGTLVTKKYRKIRPTDK